MPEYSDEVLERTPERATQFLAAVGAVAEIRTLLHEAGMTDDDLIEGRNLLLAVLPAPRTPKAKADTETAKAQRAAQAEIDQWDEPNFLRYGAALDRRFPEQGAYIFDKLKASTGSSSVKGVATFLGRLAILEEGKDEARKATRKKDKEAVEFLATRGLDKAERKRLQGLVDRALGPTDVLPEAPDGSASTARREALVKLKGWYDEWASTAKAVIKKKAYLIRLGLASRKPPTKKKSPQ